MPALGRAILVHAEDGKSMKVLVTGDSIDRRLAGRLAPKPV
ncbi:MAG TPA: hypothetical protein VE011_10710 [Candidatus Dormibacteraeota bacterium]|nr:hypothetical protein [Candidatus Dormibacteraeota bacterium]